MEESRLVKINKIIDSRIRPRDDFKGKPLYKCDICWTCRYFDVQACTCTFSYEDGLKKIDPDFLYDKEYYKPTIIRDPLYYRCMMWEEKKV